jgi:hypothetical protein
MTTSLKEQSLVLNPEELPGDHLDLLLDEVERALFIVEAREDEPGRRKLRGDAPCSAEEAADQREPPRDVRELRLQIAELVDAYPSVQSDLERVSEKMRTFGTAAGATELSARSQLLDLARLSLEAFFRLHPSVDEYESDLPGKDGIDEESGRTCAETYDALSGVLEMLRARLS